MLSDGFDPSAFDVVHAQDCISSNAAPGSVRTVHHIDAFETPELVRCHDRALREPIAHVCVSAAVAAELRAGWDIEATVIPNGVDSARFAGAAGDAPDAVAARNQWRARIGAPYVLAVGGIEPRKGTLELVDAFASVRAAGADVALVIAGGETLFDYRSYRAAFDRRCEDIGVTPMLLGPVEHDRLPSLVAGASVFAFPSIKEGFGLAALEAAAAGVPVVGRDLPVLREVFAGSAELATDTAGFAAGLLAALDTPDAGRLAEGRRRATAFTWDAAAESHLAFYRRLLGSGR